MPSSNGNHGSKSNGHYSEQPGALKRPLRENVAIAIDGGGIRGVVAARALIALEKALGKPIHQAANLVAGTSTGGIILGAVAMGMDATTIQDLYCERGPKIFRKSWRTLPMLKYLVRYRYNGQALQEVLKEMWGDATMGELHQRRPDFHLILTSTDILANTTRLIKSYKRRYANWTLRDVVMASSTLPSIFPVFEHDYYSSPNDPPEEHWLPKKRYWVDGGVGLYTNPCYTAAYEIAFCLRSQGWRLDNTTLISIGTGRNPMDKIWAKRLRGLRGKLRNPKMLWGPEWVFPSIDTFCLDATRQNVRLVQHFFRDAVVERTGDPDSGLDFRRYNIALPEQVEMDNADAIPLLSEYGDKLGQMILNDQQEDISGFSCGGPFTWTMRNPEEDPMVAV